MKIRVDIITRIGLAVLLFLCLFQMPYGYYQFLRFAAMIGFAVLAYYEYERKNIPLVIVFVGLTVLFQPLIKVTLGRQTWNIVDIIVAVGLLLSIVAQKQKNDNKS